MAILLAGLWADDPHKVIAQGEAFLAALPPDPSAALMTSRTRWIDAYLGLAVSYAALGQTGPAQEYFTLAHNAYQRAGDPVMVFLGLEYRLTGLYLPFLTERVQERQLLAMQLRESLQQVQRLGQGGVYYHPGYPPGMTAIDFVEGRWDDVRFGSSGRDVLELTLTGNVWAAEILWRRGDPQAVIANDRLNEGEAQALSFYVLRRMARLKAEVAAATGDWSLAETWLARLAAQPWSASTIEGRGELGLAYAIIARGHG